MSRRVGTSRPAVAVVGSGVSGLTAAYLLQRRYDVTLFEAEARLGGHSHTHEVPTPDGRTIALDTGFIVHNERTYPHLLRLFRELGVATRDSEMSMSVRCEGCGLEYAGARGLRGVVARPRSLARPAYLRMLVEVKKFHVQARRMLASPRPAPEGVTLGDFLAAGGYSRFFATHFLLPLVSAVWSSGTVTARRYPARYLFRFLDNHGMLRVKGSPRWKTVVGGSRTYVQRAAKELSAVLVSTPVRALRRTGPGVEVRDDADDRRRFDAAVIATHPDQALDLLADPTPAEREVLGAFPYSRNPAVLHTDGALLPSAPGARASWNYLLSSCEPDEDRVVASYDLNRLHQIAETRDHVVTLGAADRVREGTVLDRMVYDHPVYTPESLAAQRRLPELTTGATAYAGAYHGWGFHEDGCASGVRAARALGVAW